MWPFFKRTAAFRASIFAVAALTYSVALYPVAATAQLPTVGNPLCPGEEVIFNPGNGEDIAVLPGYSVSAFVTGLNFPTGIAFRGTAQKFEVFVLESGHGLPSICNEQTSWPGGAFASDNPFTPDIKVFDQRGTLVLGPLFKPTADDATNKGFQAAGPAIDIAFENGFKGGRMFATDSNQATHGGGQNNSSRLVIVDLKDQVIIPFITGLPTGDHPSEQLAFKDGWVYWSQGSTTNSGVVGHDNNGGNNQQDIPCQDITLSENVFESNDGHQTSGYSPHGTPRPGATIKAFDSALHKGVCDGAILRARLGASDPTTTIEPFSWGYRNPYGIRFAPNNHPLRGNLFVTENGEDERGARPVNNAPDRLAVAQLNPDGTPDYHGWPDRFGFLDSTQAVFNPVGGPGDDLCNPDNPPPNNCVAGSVDDTFRSKDIPVKPVLAFPPQRIKAPLALDPADVAVVGADFVPDSFITSLVKRGAALIAREGDFGFSAGNGAPEAGHDVEIVNFSGPPLQLNQMVFAANTIMEQAFPTGARGINRPTNLRFGPDGCAYLVDYGAVRDFGQSDPDTKFKGPANGPLVQIPGTGVIWKICPVDPAPAVSSSTNGDN